MRQTVCLCMIVKNEAHVIARCLASVRPIIDHWIIVDTGSSDGTQDVIRAAMVGLPGDVVERPWVDFAHNRSEALALARPHADYSFVIDADDELQLAPGFAMPTLDADSYSIDIHYGATTYRRPQMVRNSLEWRYRGVLHEFLECPGAGGSGHLPIVMKINHEGARSTDTTTYAKDAAILERALEEEHDPFLVSRYTFYLAQSWRDCGERAKALDAYLKRAELGFWAEEVFVSLLNAGRLMEALGYDIDATLAVYARATEAAPFRAEAAHAASRLCRLRDRFADGYAIAKPAQALRAPDTGLFVEPWIYDYGLCDELAVNGYWCGHYRDCLDATLQALQSDRVPTHDCPRFLQNMRFALDRLTDEPNAGDVAAFRAPEPIPSPARPGPKLEELAKPQPPIYRTIHVVWVGDEARRPASCIETWRTLNPDWKVRVWGNEELASIPWRNAAHIEKMQYCEWAGVADMMRWEILNAYGGLAIDADSICIRPLADWLFETEIFACWENEIARPGLVGTCALYAHPRNTLIRRVIDDIYAEADVTSKRAWQTVGPQRITDTINAMGYTDITIYPSHYFMPRHLSGTCYSGAGAVFANQFWGSTFESTYERLAADKRSGE